MVNRNLKETRGRAIVEQATADGKILVVHFEESMDWCFQLQACGLDSYLEANRNNQDSKFAQKSFRWTATKHTFRREHHELTGEESKHQGCCRAFAGETGWKAYVFAYYGEEQDEAIVKELYDIVTEVMCDINNGPDGDLRAAGLHLVFEKYDKILHNNTNDSHYRPLDHIITDMGVGEVLDGFFGNVEGYGSIYEYLKTFDELNYPDGFFSRLEMVGKYSKNAVELYGYPKNKIAPTTYDMLDNHTLGLLKTEAEWHIEHHTYFHLELGRSIHHVFKMLRDTEVHRREKWGTRPRDIQAMVDQTRMERVREMEEINRKRAGDYWNYPKKKKTCRKVLPRVLAKKSVVQPGPMPLEISQPRDATDQSETATTGAAGRTEA